MATTTLKRLLTGPYLVAVLFLLLLSSLYLMSGATQNSARFGQLYSLLLGVNLLAIFLLVGLILRHLWRLVRQLKRRAPGARLTARLMVMFVLLAVAPVTVVYYFSLQFLQRGIDSWFDLRTQQALEDALELGRTALDGRMRELLRQARQFGSVLGPVPEGSAALELNDLRASSEASEMTLLTQKGRVIAMSSADPADIVPAMPADGVLLQLQQGLDYARLEPGENGLMVRIAITITPPDASGDARVLHAIYPVADRVSRLADSVQNAFGHYKELSYLREPLKFSFILTLSLVLLLTLLSAVWAAFWSARRLVAPIRDLAEGTRAVAAGDYDTRLPTPSRDELGFLVRSFNEMTRKLAQARDEASRSQQAQEEQRAYLSAVLTRLSSGVITVGDDGMLRTANEAAAQILGSDLRFAIGQPLTALSEAHPSLEPLVSTLAAHDHEPDWRDEVILFGSRGRQLLRCQGAMLPGVGEIEGDRVVVLDDVTALIQAQRDAAWGEVARRLAHEIKNPLTPIQLSAERLRRKFLAILLPEQADILDRATHTIVQQVETMKEMVKAFSEYANTPKLNPRPLDLNGLLHEALELYKGEPRLQVELALDPELPMVEADPGRMRQVLINLIKNALEAGEPEQLVQLQVNSHCVQESACQFVEIDLMDDGPGFPEAMLGTLFEPYVTSKVKGTGLGLAIVKKIIEEHGGMIWASNASPRGARMLIRLPVKTRHPHPTGGTTHPLGDPKQAE